MRLLTPVILSLSCAFAFAPSSPAFESEEVTERDGGLSATADGLKIFVHEDTRLGGSA
jgi:hypothetical protein